MARPAHANSWRSPEGRDILGCTRAQPYRSRRENAHGQRCSGLMRMR